MQLNRDAVLEMFLSWRVRLLLVIATGLAAWCLPYPRIAQSEKYVPLTGLIVVVTILVFGTDLIREHSALNNLSWVRRLVSIATTIAAMASVFKGTAELQTWSFDPIRQASGVGFINFNRLIDPSEFGFRSWDPLVPQIEILTAINGGRSLGNFSITNIEQTTGRNNVNGVETLDRHTVIRFTFSSDPIAWPNRLENLSAKKFTSICNYLEIPLGIMPQNVTYEGAVNLILNGDQLLRFIIPKAYPSKMPRVFVPLNEKANQEMMKYKLYNPKGGTLDHFIYLPEPTPSSFGTWPP